MDQAPGTRLGAYDVLAAIGKGGMGEVYRARDTRLGRDVAIKTLPEEFARDDGRRARFEREAKLLASLNHPNIAAIYGLEEHEGTRFLVLELVEGDTLAHRIANGAIPVEESLPLALQIAEALEAAHERGVVHRDLKPANIAITRDGKVKVLDFGLAKAVADEAGVSAPRNSPTLTIGGTKAGVILGTAGYMSPEQASGQQLDKRADIWAFGCVLLEMLCGRPAFPDLAAVIRAEPDWDAFPSNVHPHLKQVVRRCLDKDLRARWHDIADVRVDLETIRADPRGATLPSSSAAAAGLPMAWMAAWIAAALVVGAIAGAILAPGPGAPTRPQTSRFVITHEDGDHDQLLALTFGYDMRLAPDGSELVYLGRREGTTRLYRRPLGSFGATALAGTDGAYEPFFSPDGRSLGFFSRSTLKRMQFPAGAPLDVADLGTSASGATWLSEDTIVVGMRRTGLVRIAVSDGAAEALTVPDPQRGDTEHSWPEALPGGAGVLFTAFHGPDLANARIAVWSADAGDWSIVLDEEGYNARYATSGHLIYGRASVVMMVPFDAERLEVTGSPFQVLDRVLTKRAAGQAFTVSSNGTLAFVPSPLIDAELVWMDREGTFIEPVGAPVRPYVGPHLSPDGERIVVDVDSEAWIYDIESGHLAALPGADRSSATPLSLLPSWSPDGSTIAFIAGGSRLYTAPADGSGSADLLWESQFLIWGPKWSPGGGFIVGTTLIAESGLDVWRVSLDDRQSAPYLQDADNTDWPAFSPSGSWVAYSSRESGQAEVYARPFPDSAGRRVEKISAGGGTKPLWFKGELFYRRGERVVSVRIEETPTNLRILDREPLPVVLPDEGDDRRGYDYDYDPVNDRFLVVRPVNGSQSTRIHVVVNWLEEISEISARMGARR